MLLKLDVLASTTIKRKKPWPTLAWLGKVSLENDHEILLNSLTVSLTSNNNKNGSFILLMVIMVLELGKPEKNIGLSSLVCPNMQKNTEHIR